MERKRLLLIALTAILVLVLVSACVRPASTPPPQTTGSTTTEGQSFPVPGATDDVMSQLEKAATQTLVAMQGTPQVLPTNPVVVGTVTTGQETPAVEVPTVAAPTTGAEVQPTAVPQVAAATATRAPLPTPTPGKPSSWTLQTGEFPYCLARRFDVNPDELLRLNGLSASSYYYAGMTFKIPQTGSGFPSGRTLKSHPTNYTVTSGDNIYNIACQYGDVDPYMIAAANGLTSPYNLNVGQSLYIP